MTENMILRMKWMREKGEGMIDSHNAADVQKIYRRLFAPLLKCSLNQHWKLAKCPSHVTSGLGGIPYFVIYTTST